MLFFITDMLQDCLQWVMQVYEHAHCRQSCNLFILWPVTRCLSFTGSDWRQFSDAVERWDAGTHKQLVQAYRSHAVWR